MESGLESSQCTRWIAGASGQIINSGLMIRTAEVRAIRQAGCDLAVAHNVDDALLNEEPLGRDTWLPRVNKADKRLPTR